MSDELRNFFTELSPRLRAAQAVDDELDRQLARRFNVFRYLRTDEIGLSRVIADLLDRKGDHGQGDTFLRCFTDGVGFAKGCELGRSEVMVEETVEVCGERRRIDILVKIDDEHCIAIENKSNWAADLENQVARYLDWLKRYPKHRLVYLSPNGEAPSKISVGDKHLKKNIFCIMPCVKGTTDDDGFDNLRLQFSLVDWLADCRRRSDLDKLRWYLREVEAHCKQRYGGNKVTNKKKLDIKEFLLSDKDNLAVASDVHGVYPEMVQEVTRRFFELVWRRTLEQNVLGMEWSQGYSEDAHTGRRGSGRYGRSIICKSGEWKNPDAGVCMESDGLHNTWYIGVYSKPRRQLEGLARQRRERLDTDVHKCLGWQGWPSGLNSGGDCWVYREWVFDDARSWDAIVFEMNREVEAKERVRCDRIVEKFQEVIKTVKRTIDKVYSG